MGCRSPLEASWLQQPTYGCATCSDAGSRLMEHVGEVLTQLFVLLLAAKLGDEVFKRLGQPTVIGEILGGVIVGPPLLGLYQVNAETTLFAEIGVVLLL